MKIERIWKNWTIHNMISHPLSEVVYLLTRRKDWAGWVHDITVPEKKEKGEE